MSDLRIGVTFPAGQYTHSPLDEYTRRVESLGFDSLWLIDNLGSGTPGLECLTTLGYMAACSNRLSIGTSVLLLPLHNPVLLAHAVNSLDVLSQGRLTLGIGVGDPPSHDPIGSDRRTRGQRCEESLALMQKLWTERDVSFSGRFNRVSDYTLSPRSVQTPHVPVWMGGFAPAVLARAGRYADGFICVGMSPADCRDLFAAVDSEAQTAGRARLTRAVHAYFCIAEDAAEAMRSASDALSRQYGEPTSVDDPTPYLLGTAEDCRRALAAFAEVGVTHFILDPVCRPEAVTTQLERLEKEVVRPFRGAASAGPI